MQFSLLELTMNDTCANVNGFRVLAALLHGTLLHDEPYKRSQLSFVCNFVK